MRIFSSQRITVFDTFACTYLMRSTTSFEKSESNESIDDVICRFFWSYWKWSLRMNLQVYFHRKGMLPFTFICFSLFVLFLYAFDYKQNHSSLSLSISVSTEWMQTLFLPFFSFLFLQLFVVSFRWELFMVTFEANRNWLSQRCVCVCVCLLGWERERGSVYLPSNLFFGKFHYQCLCLRNKIFKSMNSRGQIAKQWLTKFVDRKSESRCRIVSRHHYRNTLYTRFHLTYYQTFRFARNAQSHNVATSGNELPLFYTKNRFFFFGVQTNNNEWMERFLAGNLLSHLIPTSDMCCLAFDRWPEIEQTVKMNEMRKNKSFTDGHMLYDLINILANERNNFHFFPVRCLENGSSQTHFCYFYVGSFSVAIAFRRFIIHAHLCWNYVNSFSISASFGGTIRTDCVRLLNSALFGPMSCYHYIHIFVRIWGREPACCCYWIGVQTYLRVENKIITNVCISRFNNVVKIISLNSGCVFIIHHSPAHTNNDNKICKHNTKAPFV